MDHSNQGGTSFSPDGHQDVAKLVDYRDHLATQQAPPKRKRARKSKD